VLERHVLLCLTNQNTRKAPISALRFPATDSRTPHRIKIQQPLSLTLRRELAHPHLRVAGEA
jgi:hypothetical protein